jgi:competence protein ComEC
MIQWTGFPFVRFTFALMAGIGLYHYLKIPLQVYGIYFFILAVFCFLLLHFLFRYQKIAFYFKPWKGFIALLLINLFGYLVTQFNDISIATDHLLNQKNTKYYEAVVTSDAEKKERWHKAVAEVRKVKSNGNWKKASGKILLYIDNSGHYHPRYGDHLVIKGVPFIVPPSSDPGGFDYRDYLAGQHIYHQHFVRLKDFRFLKNIPDYIFIYYAFLVRNECDHLFRKYICSNGEYEVASALVLGIKSHLDNELRSAYASSGAMHVLAVSGLHVAILYGILVFFLERLKKLKGGNLLFTFSVLFILWLYAFITGLSASVLRSVIMFSFIVIARSINRNTNIYNTLAISAFILLCYKPGFLFDVGFQLSYLAVAGIIYFHPKLYHCISFNNYVSDKVWSVSCVAIAAQLTTFPLCIYYFHQFPVYFLLSNLLVIPLSFIILYVGIILLVTGWIPICGQILGFLMEKLIWLLNASVLLVEDFPFSTVGEIYKDRPEIFLMYVIMIVFILFFKTHKFQYIFFAFICSLMISGLSILKSSERSVQKNFMVCKLKKTPFLTFMNGGEGVILADSVTERGELPEYFKKNGIGKVSFSIGNIHNSLIVAMHRAKKGYSVIVWEKTKFLIIEKPLSINTFRHLPEKIKMDYIIVKNNSLNDPEKLMDYFKFKMLILDGNGTLMQNTILSRKLEKLKIPFHNMRNNGAFIVNLP